MTEFKDILKKLRLKKDLTQGELADRLKMATSSISMYENGNRKPSFEVLEQFADFFNVNMDYLLGKETKTTYYLDPETAKLAQEIHDNPQYRVLFDASKNLKPESIKEIMKFIDYQKAKEGKGNE
jgi:transcriptional regulator with XRE-family HTH domain